jgi:hypothetical protein
MRSTPRRSCSQLAAVFAVSVALAACSEPTVTPRVATPPTLIPQATLSSAFAAYQFLGYVLDDQGANDHPRSI